MACQTRDCSRKTRRCPPNPALLWPQSSDTPLHGPLSVSCQWWTRTLGLSLAAFSSAFWLKESSHSVFLSCILQGVLVRARPLFKGKAKSENRPRHPCLWGIVWGYSTHKRLLKPKAHAGPGLMREPPPGQLHGLKQGAAVCLGRHVVALSGNYTGYQIQPQHKLKGEKWARKIVVGGRRHLPMGDPGSIFGTA